MRKYGSNYPYVDCSMFASEIATKNGYFLPRTAYEQSQYFKNYGYFTDDISKVKVGDHLFWQRGVKQYHTGICTDVSGGLKVTHATTNGYRPGSIKTNSIQSNGVITGWNYPFVGAGRPFKY